MVVMGQSFRGDEQPERPNTTTTHGYGTVPGLEQGHGSIWCPTLNSSEMGSDCVIMAPEDGLWGCRSVQVSSRVYRVTKFARGG